jgi:hypothetical protein
MKSKCLIIALSSIISFALQAESFTCQFTEPFINTFYDTVSKEFTVVEIWGGRNELTKNVSIIQKNEIEFDLIDQTGNVLQNLILNYKGSDGMSDVIYPYEVKYQGLTGGCETETLRRK